MEVQETQGKSLLYLTVLPNGYTPLRRYPLIVLLHGFGANMYDLAPLAPDISKTGYLYACPNAPIAVPSGAGRVGFGWTPPKGFQDPEAIRQAEELLDVFLAEVQEAYRVEPGKVLLVGFSQGGGLAYRYGLIRPQTFSGVVVLSSGLLGLTALAPQLPPERTLPLFIAHGVKDPGLPVESARRAHQQLEEWGYQPAYHEYNVGHEIAPELLEDLVPWVHRVLPPIGGGLILP